jgi:hypothetical protein
MIIPVADAFDKFCVKAKEKSFPIDSLLIDGHMILVLTNGIANK